MSFKKVCKVCGREFHSSKYSSRFCSENCYVKARNWARQTRYNLDVQGQKKTLNEILYNKVCPNCGHHFVARKTNAIYCSVKCGKEFRKRTVAQKRSQTCLAESSESAIDHAVLSRKVKIQKICACCGKPFVAQKSTTMFCGGSCARRFRRRQEARERVEKVTSETVREHIRISELNAPDSEFLRPDDAARYLGISIRTVFRYIDSGIIRAKRLPKVTLIEKSALREMLESDVSYKVCTRARSELPAMLEDNPIFKGEHITIPEASRLYDLPLNVMQHYLRRSDLKYVKYRNTRFYDKREVDALVKERLRDRHPEITEWYSVSEILSTYNITAVRLNNQLYAHPVPKRKEGGLTYYSKSHIDEMFGYLLDADRYYTTDELSKIYLLDKRRIAKLVQRYSLPKITRAGRILIEKEPFDDFMRLNKVT